jgi:uncharacterized protein YjiS (DUF1127 family)
MKTISLGTTAGHRSRIAPRKVRRRTLRLTLRQALSRIFATLREWRRRRRERAELARLDERMLRDIGVTRGDVWNEINKPFWRQ